MDTASEPDLTSEQSAALKRLVLDPEGVFREVEAALDMWLGFEEDHAYALERWRQSLPEKQQKVIGKLDPVSLHSLLDKAQHKDRFYLRDLLQGFPITGKVDVGGLGVDIPGGILSRVRKLVDGPLPLQELRSRCAQINQSTLRRALKRFPQTASEVRIAGEVWRKTQKDIELGRAGTPMELHEVNLEDILLVEAFGILEQHGDATQSTVRGIHNFRANLVNECAFMPQKLRYDGFDQMLSALKLIARVSHDAGIQCDIHAGKADFKSAYKTLPAACSQEWLCWALVYNPDLDRLQVVPLWSQVFGSLGGVTAWFRTARAVQNIMLSVFGCPWLPVAARACMLMMHFGLPVAARTQAAWINSVFKRVVTEILGWDLDPAKECVGPKLLLLGLDLEVRDGSSVWTLGSRKREEWANSIHEVLVTDCLAPGMASKLCGRLAFLNCHVCNRLGRALLRPLIWRQRQPGDRQTLTPRLRFALTWFLRVLMAGLTKTIPLLPQSHAKVVFLYSDAEGYGGIGAVAAFPGGRHVFFERRCPKCCETPAQKA